MNRVIRELTNGLMAGNKESVNKVERLMRNWNKKELELENGYIVHVRDLGEYQDYWVSDKEGNFEIGLNLFCALNEKVQKDVELAKLYNKEAIRLLVEYRRERTEDTKFKMCELGSKLISLCEELENEIDFDTFIEIFGLEESEDYEVDREESFVENLIPSPGAIGYIVRNRLLRAEEIVKEMINN